MKHKFLDWLVRLFIKHRLFTNEGKFKPGDHVCYNWRAKVQIANVIDDNVHVVKAVHGTLCDFTNDDSADVFWLRKARKHELPF